MLRGVSISHTAFQSCEYHISTNKAIPVYSLRGGSPLGQLDALVFPGGQDPKAVMRGAKYSKHNSVCVASDPLAKGYASVS